MGFEEEYEMSAENGYRVFGSNAVGDCGGPNSPRRFLTGAPASVFVTGKEFINRRVFHCYGIQTNRYGRSNYVSAKKLKFGFKDPEAPDVIQRWFKPYPSYLRSWWCPTSL